MHDFFLQNAQLILGSLLGLVTSCVILILSQIFDLNKTNKERKLLVKKENYLALQIATKDVLIAIDEYSIFNR